MEKGQLGNAIRAARMGKGLSQEQLAEMVNITPTHLKHIESEHRKPSVDVLWKLATILNLSLDCLLFPSGPNRNWEYEKAKLLLDKCSKKQLKVIIATLEALLSAFQEENI